MGMFEHFPYTNFHDLNLDWILRHIKSLKDRLEDLIKEYNKTKVPGGGLANQVLTKKSDADYDMIWKDSSGIPAGGNTGDILTKNSATDFDAGWHVDNNLKKSGGTLDNAATLEFVDDINTLTIGANGIMADGGKFNFTGDFGFTNPVSGQPPVNDTDLATKQYVDASTSSVDGVPAGGTTGQVLAKKTDADGDTEWVDQSGGGGDFLPLAGGTMNEISEIKWTPEFKIGVDDTGTKNAMFRGASVDCRRIALVNDPSNKFLFINQDGFDHSGLTSDFRIDASFPRWVFANDVRAKKAPTADDSVVNKKYADSLAIPVGGTTGQVLGKKSNSDRDCEWISIPTSPTNIAKAFVYELPYITDTTRTELPNFIDNLMTHFNTIGGIFSISINIPGFGGSVDDTGNYCVGITQNFYAVIGADYHIPLYAISSSSVKKIAKLDLTSARTAYLTMMEGFETKSNQMSYITISMLQDLTRYH